MAENETHKEIFDRLNKIDTTQAAMNTTLININDNLLPMVKRHDRMILGDEDTRGIKARVDTLDDIEKDRKWTIRVFILGFISLICKSIWDIFKRS